MRPRAFAIAVLAVLLTGAGPLADTVPEPDGYRMQDYRAPVPATLAGATVLDTDAARALWEAGEAVFVDVLPSPPRPANLPAGTIWQAPARDTIAGAAWLPNVGYGEISQEKDRYLRDGLDRLTGGDATRPIVFFCLADCWMSWNAARRAIVEYGYQRVHWYPLGTDGWDTAGLPLEQVHAED